MTEDLNELTIGGNVLRLEHLKLPNGNDYVLGVSLEELETVYNTLYENIVAVNEDVETLQKENQALKNEITELKKLIEDKYMAYYNQDGSTGIGENNTYE